jgi:S-adenosylmethionine:tRNA ribosyltransferase-isomerase
MNSPKEGNMFVLPEELCATQPPEAQGKLRDDVRLLVLPRNGQPWAHAHFNDLAQYLRRSDLLVFNRSRTLPVVLTGSDTATGATIQIRLAERLPDDTWFALLICGDDSDKPATELFACDLRGGMTLRFAAETEARVLERDQRIPRLWRLRFNKPHAALLDVLYKFGHPVWYEYLSNRWDIGFYQNIYASEPGSAEMPSAGRAFTWRMMFDLKRRGIKSTSIVLHTGLSSYLDDELDASHPASEEPFEIDDTAADAINKTRMSGGRVIAVGTTVVRALESACDRSGFVKAKRGYTRLRIDPMHQLRAVDGLITGLHEPEASHLDMLAAFVDKEQLFCAYDDAISKRYLWHEFGDLNLIL